MSTPLFHREIPTLEDLQARLQDLLTTRADAIEEEAAPILRDCAERMVHYSSHPQYLEFIVTARGVTVLLKSDVNFSDWVSEYVTSAVVFCSSGEIDVILPDEGEEYLTDERILTASSLVF